MLTAKEWSKRENKETQLLLTQEDWLKQNGRSGSEGYEHSKGRRDFKSKRDVQQREEANLAQMQDDEPALLITEKMLLVDEGRVTPKLDKTVTNNQTASNVWYLDNRASNHMSGQLSKFVELDKGVKGQVRFGDGSMMAEDGNQFIIKGKYLWVYEGKGKLLMKVKHSTNRLYKILLDSETADCMLSKVDEESWLWHARLGHVNFKAMSLMSAERMVVGMPKINPQSEVCNGCLMSKQAKKPFPGQVIYSAKEALEIIHGDLCGPITPPTVTGNRYFLLCVDDYTRVMWVYFLKSKDEAFEAFKRFRAKVEKGTKAKIKTFRTDRGGEFTSKSFNAYYEEAGITRQLTAPYSPQQNGVVERRNRTVVEMARSFLKEKSLPAIFWAEAVRYSVYILNRLPTRALSRVTPYEAWTGRKPDMGHIRIFGCLAHMKLPANQVTKLSNRSKMVIKLGKEPGSKAYRVYDPENGTVHVSRDVIFEEKKGWSWERLDTTRGDYQGTFTVVNLHTRVDKNAVEGEDDKDVRSPEITQDGHSNASEWSIKSGQSKTHEHSNTPPARNESNAEGNSETEESSEPPRKFRQLTDIYDATEEVELDDDELMLMGTVEPTSYSRAATENSWQQAMKDEIDAVEKNHTWKLTELPAGKKAIGLKWVYKVKKDANGQVVKHKVRIIAKGYIQQQGRDFDELFAPVTRLETVRLLLALAAKNSWEVYHLDVKWAFLNGEIQEEVYVTEPEGFVKKGNEQLVYRIVKALYGLRQAPRAWYAKLSKCLEELGFIPCPYEHAVYTKRIGGEMLLMGVYVDDLLVTEVELGNDYIELKQTAYAKKILEKAGMLGCNSTKYPMDPKERITKDEGGKLVDTTEFKSIVGGLRY
ncbi:hypothetical protein AgCh_019968 [Apium graveolens]